MAPRPPEPALAPEVDLAGLRRLPLGAEAKTGPWGVGCMLLGWAIVAVVATGGAHEPLLWGVLALLAAVGLTAPHAVAWIRDGIAPVPPPRDRDPIIAGRLGLWVLWMALVRVPTALGDLAVTPAWNLVGRARAERTWRARTADLLAERRAEARDVAPEPRRPRPGPTVGPGHGPQRRRRPADAEHPARPAGTAARWTEEPTVVDTPVPSGLADAEPDTEDHAVPGAGAAASGPPPRGRAPVAHRAPEEAPARAGLSPELAAAWGVQEPRPRWTRRRG